jgi:excisionase family DNA binding protein
VDELLTAAIAKYMTIENAALSMQCSERTVKRMVQAGMLEFIEIGTGSRKSIRVALPVPKIKEESSCRSRRKYTGSILSRPSSSTKPERTR